jgi:hypothetical protein
MTDTDPAIAAFRRRNRQFYWAATAALALVALVMAMTLLVLAIKGGVMRASTLQQLPLVWTPALFYLWALWSAQRMFAALSRGGFVFQAVSTALGRIGWALTLGAIATIVIVPVLLGMGAHVVGGFALFNVPALTLGIVGLALIVTAHMMRRAQALEGKVASLNAELSGFI